jgi:hypothetical protein
MIFSRIINGAWVITVVLAFGAAAISAYPSTSVAQNQPQMAPGVFLDMLKRIALHGDLRDAEFSAKVLETHFEMHPGWHLIDGDNVLGEIEFVPADNFFVTQKYTFRYGFNTGMIRRPPEGFPMNIAYMQFMNADKYVCVRWIDVDGMFSKYETVNTRYEFTPQYAYVLFSNHVFDIIITFLPAERYSSSCISNIDLGQSIMKAPQH